MLRQWFFSKVVLTSLTNGSQCTFAVSNFLKFTFPLYFSIIFSVFKSYCFIMKIFKKICSCSSFLISASFQYLHFQYLRFQFFHSDFDVLGEPWKHRQIRQSFYSFSLILLMRCVVVYDQPACSFSVTLQFLRGVFLSHQNILQEHLDYAKVTLIRWKGTYMDPFLSFLGNTLLVFRQICQIYCWTTCN